MEKKGGKKKLSAWNIFVKKTFSIGRKKNKGYSFKQALSDSAKVWKKSKNHRKKGGEISDSVETDDLDSSDTGLSSVDSGASGSVTINSQEDISRSSNKGGRKSKKSKKGNKKTKKNRK
jgi:hypothetical protein